MLLRLTNQAARAAAKKAVDEAPEGWEVIVRERKRSEPQSAKFHAICGDVAKQALFMGKKRTKNQWKVLFISGHATATQQGSEVVPGLEGEFVNIRESSADMRGKRASSLIDYTLAWCADNGIRLSASA